MLSRCENTNPIYLFYMLREIINHRQALLTATLNSRFSSIRQSTSAIVFFGVPHRGGNGATLGQILSNTARIVTGSDKNDLVKSLQKGSSFLTHLTADFKHLHEDFDYLTVVETRGLLKAPFRSVGHLET